MHTKGLSLELVALTTHHEVLKENAIRQYCGSQVSNKNMTQRHLTKKCELGCKSYVTPMQPEPPIIVPSNTVSHAPNSYQVSMNGTITTACHVNGCSYRTHRPNGMRKHF
jgi:hypothetical protein